jgi:hypothetical protein
MGFKPGNNANPAGRPKGAVNKTTRSVREAFQAAFDQLQQKPGVNLVDWAQDNPTEFYKLSGKLIPAKVEHEGNLAVQVITGVPESGGELV